MKIKTVTITGADNYVNPADLIKIEERFPFVEWGILLSESRVGSERYADSKWMNDFFKLNPKKLSAHICGKYMRDILAGKSENIFTSYGEETWGNFKRIQLNFNANNSDINILGFMSNLKFAIEKLGIEKVIFQVNKSNDNFINNVLIPYSYANHSFCYLFDSSGGRGVLKDWRAPIKEQYCGYAGGLSGENLEEQLQLIETKVGSDQIWIDVESGVRTDNKLDLHKVCSFLKISEKYVYKPLE